MRAKEFLPETISTGLGGGSAGKNGGSMVGGPTTYEQEYNKFRKKGGLRLTAMTTEEVRTKVDTLDYELIKKIKFNPIDRQPRYIVFSEYQGTIKETNNILIALAKAEEFAQSKGLDNHVLVYDRKSKMPVVSYRGSEDVWYQTNTSSPKRAMHEKWSNKYKKSINCSNPKGFSQKAHCAGRKARQAGKHTKSKSIK